MIVFDITALILGILAVVFLGFALVNPERF